MDDVHVTQSAAELIVMTASHFRNDDMFFGSSSASRVTSYLSTSTSSDGVFSTMSAFASVSFLLSSLAGMTFTSSSSGAKLFDVEFRLDMAVTERVDLRANLVVSSDESDELRSQYKDSESLVHRPNP